MDVKPFVINSTTKSGKAVANAAFTEANLRNRLPEASDTRTSPDHDDGKADAWSDGVGADTENSIFEFVRNVPQKPPPPSGPKSNAPAAASDRYTAPAPLTPSPSAPPPDMRETSRVLHVSQTSQGSAEDEKLSAIQLLEQKLRDHFGDRLNETILKLADIPEGAHVEMVTPVLPLIRVQNIFIFPGVPELMVQSFEHMAHELKGTPFICKHVKISGSESAMADHLRNVQNANPKVQIGSYPRFLESGCEVKITIDGRLAEDVNQALQEVIEGLEKERIIQDE